MSRHDKENTVPLKDMRYEGFVKRIEQARNLNHEESRQKLLREINSALQPLRDAMRRSLGRKAEDMLDLADEENDYTEVIQVSSLDHVDDVPVYTTCLGDLAALYEVLGHIESLDLEKAYNALTSLDTAIRESVEDDVWAFFKGN